MIEIRPHETGQFTFKLMTGILLGWITFLGRKLLKLICAFFLEIHCMEQLFTNMYIIYAFLCQLLFLTMCDITILGEPKNSSPLTDQKGIVGLSALLFYSIFGYFVAKIKDIVQNDWNHSTQLRHTYSHFIKWVLKIVLEWAKAIAVVLCIRDKGIGYQPDPLYSLVTFSYYVCTEKLFIDILIQIISSFGIQSFDMMEHLYIPIILNMYAILCAAVVGIYMTKTPHLLYALFSSYFILYLKSKDLYFNYIKELMLENQTYSSFRNATVREIQKWDDICAVCLTRMNSALITPCNHLFHSNCLKRCLRTSLQCPLCKHNFIQ